MKKYLLLLLPLLAILNSCQKIDGTAINGINSGASATYQPLTAGSTWKYRIDYSASFGFSMVDTNVITMGSKTLTISNKLYTQAYENNIGFGIIDTGYYYASNHEYSTMEKVSAGSSTYAVELLYLKDNVPVGTSWTASLSYPTLGAVQLTGKITEKGISKIVAGKTFTNVIHTTIQLQMSILGTPTTVTYEIYVAPNVGIVHVDLIQPGYAAVPEDLIAYTIK